MDRWLGGLLIVLCAPWSRFFCSSPIPHRLGFGPNPPPGERQNPHGSVKDKPVIVVSKYFGMGSIILSVPLLRQIRSRYSSARIIFLSFASNREIIGFLPYIDEAIFIRTALLHMSFDIVKTLWKLRRMRVDLFFDLEFFSRFSALMNFGSGAVTRVGFHTLSLNRRGHLLTHRVYWNSNRHAAQNFLALGCSVGLASEEPQLELWPLSPAEEKKGFEYLRQRGIPRRYIVFSPQGNTVPELNAYPKERWLEVAGMLFKSTDFHVLCVGSKKDSFWNKQESLFNGRFHNLVGSTDFLTLMVVLKNASCLLSVDSGLSHLAAVFQVPTVTFFGPDTPVIYSPINPRGQILYANPHCSPCINVLEGKRSDCKDNVCINRWSADGVFEKLTALLGVTS